MPADLQTIEQEQRQQLIRETVQKGRLRDIQKLLKQYQPADIASEVQNLELEEQVKFFRRLKIVDAALLLGEMQLEKQQSLISKLRIGTASTLLDKLPADEAADVLGELSQERAQEILGGMKKDAEEVQILLSYQPDTAGGIMQKEYIAIPQNLTVKQAVPKIKSFNLPNRKTFYNVYVINEKGVLVGVVEFKDLLVASDESPISKVMENQVISVNTDMDQEEVAKTFSKYDVVSLPVVDPHQRLVGVITVDDVVDVIEEESSEDILRFSGTSGSSEWELLEGPIFKTMRKRMPWLMGTLGLQFLVALVMTFFMNLLNQYTLPLVALVAFLPLLSGLAGNVGTQSAVISVRGIALGHIRTNNVFKIFLREIWVGILMAIFLTIVLSIIFLTFRFDYRVGIVLGVSLLIEFAVASGLGIAFPVLFKKIGIDPAVSSSPLITTALDLIGFTLYFLVALTFFVYLGILK